VLLGDGLPLLRGGRARSFKLTGEKCQGGDIDADLRGEAIEETTTCGDQHASTMR